MERSPVAVARPVRTERRPRSWLRPALALAAAFLGALGAVGAVLLLAADRGVVVAGNTFVNATGLIDSNNSPTVARHPEDPAQLVVANRVDRPVFAAGLHWSNDGGRVWRHTALPLPEGLDRPYAPDIAFAPDGTLHVAYVNLTGPGNVPQQLWVARSDDAGRTLSDPVRVAGGTTFQPRIAVARDGTVHVTWLQATSVGTLQLTGPAAVVAARSTDGGRTFSAPVPVSDPHRQRVGAATPVVTSTGALLVLYLDFRGDVRDFGNLDGPVWHEPFALVVARSDDGGATFSPGVEIDVEVVPTERFLVFLPPFPSIAAGPDGTVAVAWSDGRNGDPDVFVRRSDDDGRTWSDAARVNDDPVGSGADQRLPAVAIAPSGRVDVVFTDRRDDPANVLAHTYLATSPDGRPPFRNVRISTAASDTRVGSRAAGHLPIDFGSRLGIDSGAAEVVAAWTDTRLGSEATGRQDVVAAVVRLPQDAGWRLWLTVGGLAGAVLALAGWWAAGRSDTGAS